MYLSDSQYENIKENVVDMYEECGLTTYPIDCMEIARRLNYRLVPYSKLKGKKLVTAMNISMDGFHVLVEDKVSGMFMWVIFYNDENSHERQRWTILHEIGHIRLDHTQESELAEAEANFFAKYSIAPPPLIHYAQCDDYIDVAVKFDLSIQATYYSMCYYHKWLQYGPADYEPVEIRMLELFGLAA